MNEAKVITLEEVMQPDRKIYVAGPITGVADYRKHFRDRCNALHDAGVRWVVNPACVNSHMPYDMTDEDYMVMCYSMMSLCDTIYLMEGWKRSRGARAERAYAVSHGMLIYEED